MGKLKCILPLLLAVLLLSGCSSMLDAEDWSVEAHVERPDTAEDSTIRRVESYQQLVNTVNGFMLKGVDKGVIHLFNYTRDVDTDLKNACNEVSQVDPLGAYAVEFMSYDYTPMIKYVQATINITYRHTPDQVASMVKVTSTSAIREILREKLALFSPEAVIRVGYFTEDEEKIVSLVKQAYYDTPLAALGMPGIAVTLYPALENDSEEGKTTQRVVEILLSYPDDADVLARKSEALRTQADSLSYSLSGHQGREAALVIAELLSQRITPSVSAKNNTAYSALVDGRANSEGMALVFQLLAQNISLESSVVHGTLDGADRFWNVVHLESGDWRHVDATAPQLLFATDDELSALGYEWDRDTYPICGTPLSPPTDKGSELVVPITSQEKP